MHRHRHRPAQREPSGAPAAEHLPPGEDAQAEGHPPGRQDHPRGGVQKGAQGAPGAAGPAAQPALPQAGAGHHRLRGLGRRRQGGQHQAPYRGSGPPGLRGASHRQPRAPREGPALPVALLDEAAQGRPHRHFRPHLVRPGDGGAAGGLLHARTTGSGPTTR